MVAIGIELKFVPNVISGYFSNDTAAFLHKLMTIADVYKGIYLFVLERKTKAGFIETPPPPPLAT